MGSEKKRTLQLHTLQLRRFTLLNEGPADERFDARFDLLRGFPKLLQVAQAPRPIVVRKWPSRGQKRLPDLLNELLAHEGILVKLKKGEKDEGRSVTWLGARSIKEKRIGTHEFKLLLKQKVRLQELSRHAGLGDFDGWLIFKPSA